MSDSDRPQDGPPRTCNEEQQLTVPPRRRRFYAAVLLAASGFATALTVGPVQSWGHFQRLMQGDAAAKVQLAGLPSGPGVYALGALAELRGEVLIWDGRVLVSRGERDGATERPRGDDAAALLALAVVPSWQTVPVPRDLDQAAFERWALDKARDIGVDVERPFAFGVRGPVRDLKWHVLDGRPGGGHGAHKMGHAASRGFEAAKADGLLLGFYGGAALEGVITHPGEKFHLHWASRDLARSGHVDAYGVTAGAQLLLPPSVR